MAIRKIIFSLLLLATTACIPALAEGGWFAGRLVGHVFYTQKATMDQDRPESDDRMPNTRGQRAADRGLPETSGSGDTAEAGDNPYGADAASGRRQSRLSPEERRALRRQIDEAGHDIYRRKR